jgi:hypothetical protein
VPGLGIYLTMKSPALIAYEFEPPQPPVASSSGGSKAPPPLSMTVKLIVQPSFWEKRVSI